MKVERTVEDYLDDIVTRGERAIGFCSGMTEAGFLGNLMVQAAVARCIEVVGEAAHQAVRSAPEIAKDNPDFEFRRAYATRNILVHAYGEVQQEIVWRTVSFSIPAIVAVARRILESRRNGSN